jgi:hypothetical protein
LDEPIEDVTSVELLSAHVPFSSYIVNKHNNQFVLSYGGFSQATLQVSPGDYTPVGLASELTSVIQNHLQSIGMEVQYDAIKDSYVFYGELDFELDFTPVACGMDCLSTLSEVLGFNRKRYSSSPLPSGTFPHVLKSEFRRNFNEVNYIVMDVDLLTVNTSVNNVVNKSFATISKSDYLNTAVVNKIKKYLNPVTNFDRIRVAFYDYDGNLYDFQNQNHRFELMFETNKVSRKYMS